MWFSTRKTCRNALVHSLRHRLPLRLETLEDRTVPATFTVNTLADTVDANPALTSVREAITAANSQAGDDIINFSVTGIINLTGGALPDLSSNIEIQGPGAASLTVRAYNGGYNGGHYRIFTVEAGQAVVLNGLTISNTCGIYNEGTLTVSNCTLSGNSAAIGGGIYNNGTLTVSNCTLFGNSANNGGGIATDSQVVRCVATGVWWGTGDPTAPTRRGVGGDRTSAR